MADTINPYQVPMSNLEGPNANPTTPVTVVYSPGQGYAAAWLGGPLIGIHILAVNFKALNKQADGKPYVIAAIVFTFLLIFGCPFLPDKFPNYILPLAYSFAFRQVIEKQQFTKEKIRSSPELAFQSNWKVFGFSLISLIVLVCTMILVLFVYSAMGIT